MEERTGLYADLESILVSADALQEAVRALGQRLTEDYAGKRPLMVCTLRGAVTFFADLIRAVDLPLAIDFIEAKSYSGTESTGRIIMRKELDEDIRGRDVLIVEDIIDTGRTLHCLREELLVRQPASLRIVTLLDKPSRRKVDLTPDYSCFTIPDVFAVGYGLDFNEEYRGLPEIGVLSPRIYGGK